MPLPSPAPRTHIHARTVRLDGYRRADGLWDIEGHLTDVKSYGFDTEQRGHIEPGDPIHDLWIRVTIDDHFTIHAVDAATVKAPFTTCGGILPNFQRLVGLTIGRGWTRAVKERVGGTEGCTHLAEIMGPVATTAFQTIYPLLAREKAERAKAEGRPVRYKGRPPLLDMCHMFRSDGDLVRRHWPDHYTGGVQADPPSNDRDARQAAAE
ncbi:hypothetical protein M2352_001097 [Azospirillum fermentarium]|uniref:DUF2889 domain-containing protein n=1 Tax=Azospirillum fermentarium TaxID=1233114 RepID=UPI002226976C|nr:DUF2889 domain-containing protein [Azospirillum fermentarium]MCW2245506.1 hypothetical protein [Azospirillum fermentarium]